MSVNRINPSELARPNGFSHAVIGRGVTVFLAGQTAMNADGDIVGETIPEQFRQALTNVLTALRAAGGTPEDLASVTVYTTDITEYKANAPEIGTIWREIVGRSYPAMAGIGVSRLWDAEAKVEIQGFAVLSS